MYVHKGHTVYTVKDFMELLETFPAEAEMAFSYQGLIAYSVKSVTERPQDHIFDGVTKGVIDVALTPSYIAGVMLPAGDDSFDL